MECADLSALSAGDLSPSNGLAWVFSGAAERGLADKSARRLKRWQATALQMQAPKFNRGDVAKCAHGERLFDWRSGLPASTRNQASAPSR